MDAEIEDNWDFYFARIDDESASVLLNFGYRPEAPLASAPHLLWIWLSMDEPDQHGMGTKESADQMVKVEEALTDHLARTLSARHVSRIRGEGCWQLYYYAPSPDGFDEQVRAALVALPAQEFNTGTKHDPEWSYYLEFLWPDEERRTWMRDRHLCDRLEEKGDVLTIPRPVDHMLYFPTRKARRKFEKAIDPLGFEVLGRGREKKSGDEALPFSLNIVREDTVDLESIHSVVMELKKSAEAVGGDYDGWGCVVTTKSEA